MERIAEYRPRVLAATFYLFNRMYLLKVLRLFAAQHPHSIVIGGGPEFLGPNRDVLAAMPQVAVAVRGEVERALPAILRSIDDPSDWDRIPGVCRMKDGRYMDNGAAAPAADLDRLPMPYARLIEGRRDVPVARAYRLDAGGSYIFAYASGQAHGRVAAVYEAT